MPKLKHLFLLFCAVCVISVFINGMYSTQPILSKLGSRSEEVRQIQTRLKSWGYDVGAIDGVYGQRTRNAVIKFQKGNGLTPDGIAGPSTLAKIGIPTGTTQSHDNNTNLLARLISAEARGEPFEGQVAVGAVVLNRVKHPSFPNTIAGVIFQPGAFTAVTDGQWNADVTDSSYRAARNALNGWDPSGGAIYYYNPAKTTSKWIYSRPVCAKIGSHIFAK